MVIFSHAFYLGGWGGDPTLAWTHGRETIGGFAVVGFFAVSGYLITKSGLRADIVQFLWRRSLRILPAFWGALVVGATVVGPLVWLQMGRPIVDYFHRGAGGPLEYVWLNSRLTMRQWGIHDIFVGTTPYGAAFNGSLWTLIYEWHAYMVIAAVILIGVLRRVPSVVISMCIFVWFIALAHTFGLYDVTAIWPGFADRYTINLTLAFLIGGAIAVTADRLVLDGRIAIAAAVLMPITMISGGWVLIGYAAFAYVLMYLAARIPGRARRVGQKNDYSYGIYVYGWLVQQLTAYWGWNHWGYVPWVAATLVITSACAYLSWHLIEKRALRLKNWGPGRGLEFWWGRTPISWQRLTRVIAGTPSLRIAHEENHDGAPQRAGDAQRRPLGSGSPT
jgi:peptidoglycan/LPS O-acetylase OafA/YrhL